MPPGDSTHEAPEGQLTGAGRRRFLSTRELSLAALGAAGLYFGQPNTVLHLPFLVLLFPFCLYILALDAPSPTRAFTNGFALGLAGNCAVLYWLVFPMRDVAGLPIAAAAFCALLLCAYLALFPALAALAMRGLVPGGHPGVCGAILSGLVYGGFEALCGMLFTGFPWVSLGSAFAYTPLWTQAASIVGSYGLSGLFAGIACLGGLVILGPTRGRRLLGGLFCAGLLAALCLFGNWRLSTHDDGQPESALSLIMIQGNIDQNQKWAPEFQQATLDHYLALSRQALSDYRQTHGAGASPDLLLWPETAMPFYFQLHREFSVLLRRFAIENNLNLLFGCLGLEETASDKGSLHNRIYRLSPLGSAPAWYDKRHLVPFGEYIPFAAHIPLLENLLQGMDFSPGSHSAPIFMEYPVPQTSPPTAIIENQGLSLGMLICYEAIFPELAQQQVEQGAAALINLSNDGWFRQSSAPRQHLALAIMRCVEQARPMARCTNTGITAVIDARGRVLQRGHELFTTDSMEARLQTSGELTPYHHLHPLPQYALALLALLCLAAGFALRRNHIGNQAVRHVSTF